jgi:mannose-6-phosphate isomerase-like protein (cupin superfamily)
MNLPVQRHSDERRDLTEYVADMSIRACKVLVAKDNCAVGQHYHKRKHEIFYLIAGFGTITLDGETQSLNERESILVRRGVMHSFKLSKGAILLGAATEPFDPEDDYTE